MSAYLMLSDFIALWRRLLIMKLLIIQFFQPPVTEDLLGPNILLGALFPDTPDLWFSLNVRDDRIL
jgi:hypothetical protein